MKLMRKLFFSSLLLFGLTTNATGLRPLSWNFNHDAGFGFYQPEGWRAARNGRSSTLRGPETDSAQSEFFFASDWVSGVKTPEELRAYVQRETGRPPAPRELSGLPGFVVGDRLSAGLWALRAPGNVIILRYELRGSPAQISEGEEVLSSFEVRTGGIEYP